ncbi:MAG: ectoine hydroxylase-related dioxygenase (phytanoyl-CoA dioxygenase family) [Candidatus Azotimanducaceae bacterium]|jgi:ectoine hydroxylase-related dioxygenase (phytanoyl-CoA dioxygenase family)
MTTRLQSDPDVAKLPLNDVGWFGTDRQSPDIVAKTHYLESHNGIQGLEILNPDEIDRARDLFYRDGFVVIQNVLSSEQLTRLKDGCDREIHSLLANDKDRTGNRGSHRYSFGSASRTGQLLHCPEWAMLLDLPTLTPVMTAIFGSREYRCSGGGGDFCLPGAVNYQPLHSDMDDRIEFEHKGKTITFGSFHDPRGKLNYRDLPCPFVCCNFLISDATTINGPTRQVPGTQHSQTEIPMLESEPEWMRLSTVCPAPAGSVMIRDVRAWHGGTPNLSNEVRAIPNVEFYAPWYRSPIRRSMPRDLYDTLSDHGKALAQYVAAEPGETLDLGYRGGLGGTPPGF